MPSEHFEAVIVGDGYRRDALESGRTIESKVSAGGTASARVEEQLERAREALTALRA